MAWLSLVGNLTSIVGLFVSVYTLYKVGRLPVVLKRHSRDRQLTEIIDKITRLPPSKTTITESTISEIEFIISAIRTYYLAGSFFRSRTLEDSLMSLELELKGQKRRVMIQNQLRLIRDEIAIR